MRRQRPFQIGINQAGLHHRQAVLDAQFEDLVHAGEVHYDPRVRRHREPREARARTPRRDRDLLAIRQLHDFGNLRRILDPHRARGPRPVLGRIVGIGHHIDQAVRVTLLTHDPDQSVFDLRIQHNDS